jgi:hypothetical protein
MGRLVDASANQGRDLWISPEVVQFGSMRAQLFALSVVCVVSTAQFHRRFAGCFCGIACWRCLILFWFGVAFPFSCREMREFFISGSRLELGREVMLFTSSIGAGYWWGGRGVGVSGRVSRRGVGAWFVLCVTIVFSIIVRSGREIICKRGKRFVPQVPASEAPIRQAQGRLRGNRIRWEHTLYISSPGADAGLNLGAMLFVC